MSKPSQDLLMKSKPIAISVQNEYTGMRNRNVCEGGFVANAQAFYSEVIGGDDFENFDVDDDPMTGMQESILCAASPFSTCCSLEYPTRDFLSVCFCCKCQFSHGKDVYMYKIRDLTRIWNERSSWFHRPIHKVAYMLHPKFNKANTSCIHWKDRNLLSGWTSYLDKVFSSEEQSPIEKQALLFAGNREEFARELALKEEDRNLGVTWWEIHGRLFPELQSLALRVLSQDCTSGAAERIWSICADIHTKKRNKLSTSQLEKLVYINANLRLLEKLKGDGEVLQWKVKEIESKVLENLEAGLARGEHIGLSFIQMRKDEELAYDFLREDEARFRRVTRAQARASFTTSPSLASESPSLGPIEPMGTSMDVDAHGTTQRSIIAYRRGSRRNVSFLMQEMMQDSSNSNSDVDESEE